MNRWTDKQLEAVVEMYLSLVVVVMIVVVVLQCGVV